MRTTITLDPDTEALLRRAMNERGTSLKQTVNAAIRAGLAPPSRADPYRTPTFRGGLRPGVDLDRALLLADRLEDDEILRKAEVGK